MCNPAPPATHFQCTRKPRRLARKEKIQEHIESTAGLPAHEEHDDRAFRHVLRAAPQRAQHNCKRLRHEALP